MRRLEDREALDVYAMIKSALDSAGTDRLQPKPSLTIVRQGNVVTVSWRPYAVAETVLCVVDAGDGYPPCITFRRSGWTKVLKRCVGVINDAEVT